ncbi:glycosyltransferase family 2 protein [Methylosinus sp. LW4]|uniref:glycosyltransferase family 2 protein n=1 Tax=Methylosinus sp. LW4 TaxID=136993 RepID=UPI00036D4DDC|nr:glycosyltransferase family 2 protein [Methylosinus sp. LW4]
MSVNPVDRVSPYPPAPHRDDGAIFPRRREPEFSLARQRARPASETPAPGAGRPLPPEIAFLAAHGAPLVMLQYGATIARRQGVKADAALIAEGLIPEERFYRILAAELRVPYLEAPPALEPSESLEQDAARGYARLAEEPRGMRWLFAPRGDDIARLIGVTRSSAGRPLFAITRPSHFEEALRGSSSRRLAEAAAYSVERVAPELAARRALAGRAPIAFALGNLTLLAAWLSPAGAPSRAAAALLALLFLANIGLRLYFCAIRKAASGAAPALEERDLPLYSIIVALYDEAGVVPQLTEALDAIDYPRAKLDVKFVVECDDVATTAALRAAHLRPGWEIIVAPPGAPRTKPRALNVATPFLRGSLVAVFDAEDLPDRGQLRDAAALFAAADETLACLQASLFIHNHRRSWMTAMFCIDYAVLFDVIDKGASAAGLPFFLGGSSNHFRLSALRAVGAWDAFNVTEDADLGLRLARRGYTVRTFASRTQEQAPTRFAALVAQRSRWMKGWMQTALVHCREPSAYFADLGALRGVTTLALLAGGFIAPLHGPIFLLCLVHDAGFGALLAPRTLADGLASFLFCLTAAGGLAASVWPRAVAMGEADIVWLWPALLRWPLWSLMLSLASWRALRELCVRPFYWDKTEHFPIAGARNR